MAYLPDTGIILRMVNNKDPLYQTTTQAVEKLEQNGEEIVIVPQILVEFWTVATRPVNVNGFGMTTEEAEQELENLQNTFTLRPEDKQIFNEWKRLVVRHKVSGKTTHAL